LEVNIIYFGNLPKPSELDKYDRLTNKYPESEVLYQNGRYVVNEPVLGLNDDYTVIDDDWESGVTHKQCPLKGKLGRKTHKKARKPKKAKKAKKARKVKKVKKAKKVSKKKCKTVKVTLTPKRKGGKCPKVSQKKLAMYVKRYVNKLKK
jgi:hypothetical protein